MKNILSKEGKQEIMSRLDRLTENTPARWGSMKVNQMLAHMNDAMKIALGMKAAVDRSTPFSRYVTFRVGVYVLPIWPKGEATAPELNQKIEGTPARDLYTELEFAKKMLDIISEREESKFQPHPMFGKLSKTQWSDLLYKHFQHHLRQFGV